jgi:two-component system alkaline phosphatase synthesis response regulator PhoP
MKELVARVNAQLRRASYPPTPEGEPVLVSGDLSLDLGRREVTRAGVRLDLKAKEFELLALLIENRGQALTRGQLLLQVWKYEDVVDTRTVDVHISRLREKIEDDTDNPVRIVTVRGLGYKFIA